MSSQIDNIVVGTLVDGLTLEDLGALPDENTIFISMEEAKEDSLFLPKILIRANLFSGTSEVKRIHEQRIDNTKIVDPYSRNLWRTLDRPEMTHFKIGKKVFWLIVGE